MSVLVPSGIRAIGRTLPGASTKALSPVAGGIRGIGRTIPGASTSTGSNVGNRITGAENKLLEMGGQIPEKKTNVLGWLLENLPRTGYGATNMLREFTNGDQGLTANEFDPLAAWGRGFNKLETPLGKDIMTDFGLEGDKGIFGGDPHIYNPSLAGMAGLALDIFNPADPLNWIGFGLGGAAKSGGIKGATALSKSFGSQGANIASLLGEEAIEGFGARTVGKLIKQVTETGRKAGLDEDGMARLVNYLKEGMTEAKVTPKSKLNYWQGKPITVGLQNPLTLGLGGNFAELPVKGSEHLTAQISKGINAFNKTKVGDTVGEMFNFNHVAKNSPKSLFIRDRAANEIGKMIRDVRSGKTKLPVSSAELASLRETLKKISVSNVYDINAASGGINFDVLAGFTGIDSKALLNLFDNELPFTYSIPELFTKLKKGGATDADAFTQAALLRGTMDKVVDLIPNEYRTAFKGTIMTPGAGVDFYEGSPAYGRNIRGTDSPFINYIFNHKGIDIAIPVNTSENFNVGMWDNLNAVMKAIDEMPEGVIQKYKEELQISPVKLGHPEGGESAGVTLYGQITLSDPKYYSRTLAHEFGHVLHSLDVQAGGAFGNDYLKAAAKDPKEYLSDYSKHFWEKVQLGGPADDIEEAMAEALGEDIAEAFRLLKEDHIGFAQKFPNRAAAVEKALEDGKLTNDEIAEIMARQEIRAQKTNTAYGAEKQLGMIMAKLDSDVVDTFTKGGDQLIDSATAVKQMKEGYLKSFERSSSKATDFVENTKKIFKGVSADEMRKIIDLASSLNNEQVSKISGGPNFLEMASQSDKVKYNQITKEWKNTWSPYYEVKSKMLQPGELDINPHRNYTGQEPGRYRVPTDATASKYPSYIFDAIDKKTGEVVASVTSVRNNPPSLTAAMIEIFERNPELANKYGIKAKPEMMSRARVNFIDEGAKPSFYSQLNDRLNPTYHSVLQQTVNERMPDNMKVPSLRNLFKQFGVTDEELQWTFMDEFFKGKDKVSKAEVQQWLDWNNLQIEETILGELPLEKGSWDNFRSANPEASSLSDAELENIRTLLGGDPDDDDQLWNFMDRLGETHGIDEDAQLRLVQSLDRFNPNAHGNQLTNVDGQPRAGTWDDFMAAIEDEDDWVFETLDEFFDLEDAKNIVRSYEDGGPEQAIDNIQSISQMTDEEANQVLDVIMRNSDIIPAAGELMKRPHYPGYTIPGGEDYRELLLKLPERYGVPKTDKLAASVKNTPLSDAFGPDTEIWVLNTRTKETLSGKASKIEEAIISTVSRESGFIDFEDFVIHRGDEVVGYGDDYFTEAEAKKAGEVTKNFVPPHFDGEKNLAVHARFNTRTTPDGKKILFIEEIQSDWHQQGYRGGYYKPSDSLSPGEKARINNRIDELRNEISDLFDEGGDWASIQRLEDEKEELFQKLEEKGKVPDAPFKETWRQLVIKRLLKYASEEGFDGISWTTGAQQNKRWYQTKQAEYIGFNPQENRLVAMIPNGYGRTEIETIYLNEKKYGSISKYLTKEQIEYLTKGEPRKYTITPVEKVKTSGISDFYNDFTEPTEEEIENLIKMSENPFSSNPLRKVKYEYKIVDEDGNAMTNWSYKTKEQAEKALKDYELSGQDWRYITRADSLDTMLQWGGGGFRATYDQAIPDVMRSLTKKQKLKVEDIELGGAPENTMLRDYFDDEDILEGMGEAMYDFIHNSDEFDATIYETVSDTLENTLVEAEFAQLSRADADYLTQVFEGIIRGISDDAPIPLESLKEVREAIKDTLEKRVVDSYDKSVKLNQKGILFTPEARDFYKGNSFPKFLKQAGPDPDLEKVHASLDKLSPEAQNAFHEFIKWRESVLKEYQKREIPVNVIDKYVPFVFIRKGNSDEMDALGALFGTGSKPEGDDISSIINWLSGSDPNLKPRTTQAYNPAEVNKLLSKNILSEDAGVIMATRGVRGIQALELYDFGDEMAKTYGMTIDEMTKFGMPEGYKLYLPKVSADGRRTFEEVVSNKRILEGDEKAVFLPEELVKIYNGYADLVFGERGMNNLLKTYDKATSIYKKFAYLWNPGHIIRDFTGNVFNGYLMGLTNPKIYAEAAQYLSNPDMVIKIPGFEKMTAKEFTKMCREHGILDIGSALTEFSSGGVIGTKKTANPAVKAMQGYDWAMREGTKRSDAFTRMAGMIYNLRQGKSFEESAVQVKKFYFDYFELTSFERKVMKRIVPFYTWMRKNIPLQLEMLVKNPREYARIGDAMNAANQGPIDWSDQPEYIQDTGAFPVANSDYYMAPNLPFSDLSRGVPTMDTFKNLLSSVNPLIKAPIEMATNNQWFSGMPIEKYAGEQRDLPLAGILRALGIETPTVNKRGLGYFADQLPLLRNVDAITNPDNPRQIEKASSFLGGPGLYKKDSIQTSSQYDTLDQLMALIQQLKAEQEREGRI